MRPPLIEPAPGRVEDRAAADSFGIAGERVVLVGAAFLEAAFFGVLRPTRLAGFFARGAARFFAEARPAFLAACDRFAFVALRAGFLVGLFRAAFLACGFFFLV